MEHKMKIAYVYDAIYPYVKGGAEKRIWEFSKRLANRGHEIHLFGMKYWNGGDVFVKDGVYLHGICEPLEFYVDGKRSINEAIYFSYRCLIPLMKKDFDIIDCCAFPYFPSISSKICSSLKRNSLVITWHEVWDDYWYEYLGKKGVFGKVVERMTAHTSDKIIAVSERTKKNLEMIGVSKEIEIIPNGIDFEKIKRIEASESESDIIFVGRLIKEKNVDFLIKAVNLVKKKVPDVRCIIIGDGPEKETLEKLVVDLGLGNNIKFTGFLENYEDVISHMKSSKVFVLPSTREGFGIAALEANACGLPVVTVDYKRNAASDFIIDGNGFRCKLSERDIAEKIFKALAGKGNIKGRCIEIAEKYNWDEIVASIENFYRAG